MEFIINQPFNLPQKQALSDKKPPKNHTNLGDSWLIVSFMFNRALLEIHVRELPCNSCEFSDEEMH
jgi:hypothetical protein